mgnify:CR=1 FL=1|jgi:uncharacterized membrane protein
MKGSPTTALILAIASFLTCGILLSIPALLMANDYLKTGGPEASTANTARIIAIVNIALSIVGLLIWVLVMAGVFAFAATAPATSLIIR